MSQDISKVAIRASNLSYRTTVDGGYKLTFEVGGDLETAIAIAKFGTMRDTILEVTIRPVQE